MNNNLKQPEEKNQTTIINIVLNETKKTEASPCDGCAQNPKNGGSGVCHCILGTQVVY